MNSNETAKMEDYEQTTEVLGFAPRVEQSGSKQLCLVVVNGAEKGAVFALQGGAFILGRSAQHSDFVLNGRGLSRAHARLTVDEGGRVEVSDLGSTNGVFVNGQKVEQSSMQPGDTLTLGPDVSLRLDAPDQSIQSLLQEMHRGATQDSLTGLLNRRSFMERLQEEASATTRHSLQTCLALVDVDHFKKVNDTYGHPAGDAVLVEVAARLAKAIRSEDVVARFGGEEFILLLRHTGLAGAMVLMERIRVAIAEGSFDVPTPEGARQISITISSGVAQLEPDCAVDQVLEKADVALYSAKRGGRNQVRQAS